MSTALEDEPFPSVPTPEPPYHRTVPSHPYNREFPYAPPQQKKQLQELLAEQRARNKLAKAFDETLALQNVRTARAGPDGDGGVYSIIDMAIKTKVNTLNFVSTGLTDLDFNPYSKGTVSTLVSIKDTVLRQQLPIQSIKGESLWLGEWRQLKAKANPITTLSLSSVMAPTACHIITFTETRDNQ